MAGPLDHIHGIYERLGQLDGKVTAAHKRIDELTEIRSDVKELLAAMNRGKGWAAAGLLIAGAFGAAFVELLKGLFITK